MVLPAVLGGVALGASLAAILDNQKLGQDIVIDPPEEDKPALGPVVSVEPEPGKWGDSFFGVAPPFYFMRPQFCPFGRNRGSGRGWGGGWGRGLGPREVVCVQKKVDGVEVTICKKSYPVQTMPYAWGPPGGWL